MRTSTSLLLVTVLATTLFASRGWAVIVEHIAAIVNDDMIASSDVDKYAARIKSGGLTDDLLIPDEKAKQELLANRVELLQNMIDEKILDDEAKKQSVAVPIERVEQEIRNIAKKNGVSRDDLKAALKDRGIEFSAYQDFIRTGLEHQALVEKSIQSKIKISEDDVLSAFTAAHGPGDQAFEYTLSHLYFSSTQKGGANAAHARAETAHKRLKAGESFDRLAAEISEDPKYEEGGVIGSFKTGELQKDLESVVEKLAPGEYSGVMPTAGGFQIVRVNKKKVIADPRTEHEREHIRAELYEKAFKRQLKSWLEQLRQEAFVRINPESPT